MIKMLMILRYRTFIFLLLSFILFTSSSCTGRRSKLDHKKMIPEKELPSLLAEIYMSDGLLSLPSIRSMYSSLDSLSGYVQVVEKHGYTKAEMDKTMKFYFIKKPKELVKIYDRALGILSEKESYVEKEVLRIQAHIENKWTGGESFYIFDSTGPDSVQIDIPLEIPGYYTLNFRARLYPGDQLEPAEICAYTCHRDSSENGKREYIRSVFYIKDGQPHDYSIKILVPASRPLRLRGYFYDINRHPEKGGMNAVIDNISLTYTLAAV
jgi:hypothetical protein